MSSGKVVELSGVPIPALGLKSTDHLHSVDW